MLPLRLFVIFHAYRGLLYYRFLLAQLHLDSLSDKTTAKAMKLTLQNLPRGSDALEVAYKDAWERIECQKPGFAQLAKQIITWTVCARRHLTTLELQHALAVEKEAKKLDEDNIVEVDQMINVCAGLVTVDEESKIIRLVHYTTQEFFERTLPSWAPSAHLIITKTCLRYLSFDAFSSEHKHGVVGLRYMLPESFFQRNPFLHYAALNWGFHAESLSKTAIETSVLPFLGNQSKISFCSNILELASLAYPIVSGKPSTAVHLAAELGLEKTLLLLVENGHFPDGRDDDDMTPLCRAAGEGHYNIVRLLLRLSDVDINSKDIAGWAPLTLAILRGNDVMVELLLRSNETSAHHPAEIHTSLSSAAASGNDITGELLIAQQDIDINSRDHAYRTALSYAAQRGKTAVVKLLLDRPDVEAIDEDKDGLTPLMWAAVGGFGSIMKMLLKRDDVLADLRSNAKHRRFVVSHAVRRCDDALATYVTNVINCLTLSDCARQPTALRIPHRQLDTL